MSTETATVDVASREFVSDLGRVLARHGYRAVRNFEVRLDEGAPGVTPGENDCCGDLTVLQIFREPPASGCASTRAGVISVRGQGGRSTVSLTTLDGEGDLAAQFASMMVDVMAEFRRHSPARSV